VDHGANCATLGPEGQAGSGRQRHRTRAPTEHRTSTGDASSYAPEIIDDRVGTEVSIPAEDRLPPAPTQLAVYIHPGETVGAHRRSHRLRKEYTPAGRSTSRIAASVGSDVQCGGGASTLTGTAPSPFGGGGAWTAADSTRSLAYSTDGLTKLYAWGDAGDVDARATAVTIWQAEGVLMELLGVSAAEALWWLVGTAAQRAEPVEAVAAEVVEHRTI
jgi:hypothetical protein